jgi:exo-beta-1,3-glucanase (GH17 family)
MKRTSLSASLALLLALLFSGLTAALWAYGGRPQPAGDAVAGGKFMSLSFAPFRPGQSPLRERFPSAEQADADMAQLAPVTEAVRTYAAIEGSYDAAALAQKHGLKLWQGIWLGADRVKNQLEIARGIALAHQYPDTITRVIVGNEVLLRRDLPPDALIAALEQVRHAVKQPVAYADVWDFWRQFPEIAAHVDTMLIHLLPYWEDNPTGIDGAVKHVADTYQLMKKLFPGKEIAIGETGWPSEGRARRDAVPSRVNQARFLRQFIALSRTQNFSYNFIEAFDQDWKYESEGRVGANWGIFDSARALKIPLQGPVSNLPHWRGYAGLAIAAGFTLAAIGGFGVGAVTLGFVLANALAYAATDAWPFLYDISVTAAAAINLAGQALLAAAALRTKKLSEKLDGAATLTRLRQFYAQSSQWRPYPDLLFLFSLAASINQTLLACDSRYRDFPAGPYAVPLILAAIRLARGRLTLAAPRENGVVVIALSLFTAISITVEGFLNTQSLLWNLAAFLLALSVLIQPKSASAAPSAP